MPEALLKEYLRSLREDHASGEAAVEVSGMGRCRRSSTLPGSASPRAYAPDAPLTRQVAGKLAVALKTDRHDLAVAENVSYMSRLAVGGKLSRKVAAGVAAHLIENEPDSEAGRRLTEAALE